VKDGTTRDDLWLHANRELPVLPAELPLSLPGWLARKGHTGSNDFRYELSKTMAPKYGDQQQPLPKEYVAAICRALGIIGQFKPLIHDVRRDKARAQRGRCDREHDRAPDTALSGAVTSSNSLSGMPASSFHWED
jgi:hypothetical protein